MCACACVGACFSLADALPRDGGEKGRTVIPVGDPAPSLLGADPIPARNPGVRLDGSYPLLPFVMCTLQQIDVSRTTKRHNSEDCFSKTNFILSSLRSFLPSEVLISRPMVELLSIISVTLCATYYVFSSVTITQPQSSAVKQLG